MALKKKKKASDETAQKIAPVILSGGMGTRLWPMSRAHYPKQFLPLAHESFSLIQQTANRVKNKELFLEPSMICNAEHRFLAVENMDAIGLKNMPILLEPCSRNTAAAVAVAALHVTEKYGTDAVLMVLPSDHVVRNDAGFIEAVQKAKKLADKGYLVTFGIETDYAETGYGYIKAGKKVKDTGGHVVDAFIEKPDKKTAQKYVDSKSHYWNSGMFMFKANVLLEELMLHNPDVTTSVQNAFQHKEIDGQGVLLSEVLFSQVPDISIDYAVMESTEKAAFVPVDCSWSDAGSWDSLWREADDKDESGNVVHGGGYLVETENCYIACDEAPPVATLGVSNLIIISTRDCILVADKSRAQDVKKLVEHVRAQNPDLITNHRKVYRPWGAYDSIDFGDRHQVKRISVNEGASLSLQMHFHRAEHWIVVSGTALVTCGDDEWMVTENESVYIPSGTTHRLKNPGKIPLELIEVQSGAYLGEDDIVRFEDRYGRVPASA